MTAAELQALAAWLETTAKSVFWEGGEKAEKMRAAARVCLAMATLEGMRAVDSAYLWNLIPTQGLILSEHYSGGRQTAIEAIEHLTSRGDLAP